MPIPIGYAFICLPVDGTITSGLGKNLTAVPENNGGGDESRKQSANKHELPLFIKNHKRLYYAGDT